MQAYHAGATQFQFLEANRFGAIIGWFVQKLEQRRTKQAINKHIVYLRTLDRHQLEDIGVDIATLHSIRPKLGSLIPLFSVVGQSPGQLDFADDPSKW